MATLTATEAGVPATTQTAFFSFAPTSTAYDAGVLPVTAKRYMYLYCAQPTYIVGMTVVADATPSTSTLSCKAIYAPSLVGTASTAVDIGAATLLTASASTSANQTPSLTINDNGVTDTTSPLYLRPVLVPAGNWVGFLTSGTAASNTLVGVVIRYRAA